MAIKKFLVIRAHHGDREYTFGEERVADEREVAHLIGKCLAESKEVTPAQSEGADNIAAPSAAQTEQSAGGTGEDPEEGAVDFGADGGETDGEEATEDAALANKAVRGSPRKKVS